jgi:hypothetical protein
LIQQYDVDAIGSLRDRHDCRRLAIQWENDESVPLGR